MKKQEDPHPLVVYGDRYEMTRKEVSIYFEISYAVFRQIIGGHGNASYTRALEWERISGGDVKAMDVLEWQTINGKRV